MQFECCSCKGTGLYEGFVEREGEAVVCIDCGGSGSVRDGTIPFVVRRPIPGIKRVRPVGLTVVFSEKDRCRWFSIEQFERLVPAGSQQV